MFELIRFNNTSKVKDFLVIGLVALVCALGLLLSFPIYDFWGFAFLSYSLYAFLFLELSKKKSNYYLLLFFLFSFLFYFFKRSVELESIYYTAVNYFQNATKGVVFVFILFSALALYSAMLNAVALWVVQRINNKILKIATLILILIIISSLNDIYLPIPPELVLFQNKYLMASLFYVNVYAYKFLFYLSCILLAHYSFSIRHLSKIFILIISTFILLGLGGKLAIDHQKNHKKKIELVLFQTNQSSLDPKLNYSPDQLFSYLKNSDFSQFHQNDTVFFVWPESSLIESEETLKHIKEFQQQTKFKQVHLLGTYQMTNEGLVNKLLMVNEDGNVQGEYVKNILCPLGEKNLDLFIFPSDWTKVNIPVLNSSTISPFIKNGFNFLPLICYESVIDNHYARLLNFKSSKYYNIMINVSKDSFYEKTSLIKLHSIYSSMKSSSLGMPMIRVTSTENTELLSSTGEILARTKPNQVQILKINEAY